MRRVPFPASVFFAILLCAGPGRAVMRLPDLDPQIDTLELLPPDAHRFQVYKKAGNDLHQAGFFLSLAAIPALFLTPALAEGMGWEKIRDPLDADFLYCYTVIPMLAGVIASGNMVYAEAARYHPDRDFPITRSFLPLLVFGLAAGKAFYYATNPNLEDLDGAERVLTIAFAFSELLTIPALRGQFKSASIFLDQVQIRVTGQGPSVGMRVDF